MAISYQEPTHQVLGNADSTISPSLKAWISAGSTMICGVIGEGTTVDLQASWDTPFNDVVGSKVGSINGALDISTGRVIQTEIATTQVWAGNRPLSINLVLELYALHNPAKEVEAAINQLRQMATPELSNSSPLGRSPDRVMLNLRRKLILDDCVIESISEPFDEVVDGNGDRIKASVTLAISTTTTLSKSDLP